MNRRNGKTNGNGHGNGDDDESSDLPKPERGVRKRLPRTHAFDQPKHAFPPQTFNVKPDDARLDNWKKESLSIAQRRGPNGQRQPANVDPVAVADLAFRGMRKTSAAALLGVVEDVITRRFDHAWRTGKAVRELMLRDAQTGRAAAGDTSMLIFLGKNELGQAEKTDHTHKGLVTLDHRAAIARLMNDPAANAAAELYAERALASNPPMLPPADEIIDPDSEQDHAGDN